MTRPRRRAFLALADALEVRCLLTLTPTAVWIGQDGHDLAGGATALAGNGVQDIHIALSGLPADDPISTIQILGYGGGGWLVNIGPYAAYDGVLEQAPGATTADLYVDPEQTETGRQFTLTITYDDGTSSVITMQGGTANPNLRMPGDQVEAQWLGQDGQDFTGPNPGVGPDGYQDVDLALSNLFGPTAISAVTVTDPIGDAWASGTNPNVDDSAVFVRNTTDPTLGDVYFSPTRDLNGQTLSVTVTYADGKTDQTTLLAGSCDPTLAMPAPAAVSVNWNTISATWLGQDGFVLLGQGDVHLALSGIPTGRSVVSATLSDQSDADWTYTAPNSVTSPADPSAMALGFQNDADPTRADLTFQPVVNEAGSTLTLLVTLDNGSILATRIAGGECDPGLRAPGIADMSIVAYPGDDLDTLANSYGTVRLTAGVYAMDEPLVLNQAVTIVADPGVTLLFSQAATDPTWTAAIKVRASHTTLSGFSVRFATTIRWTANISFGPAVVGWSDNYDTWSGDPGVDLTFENLDIQCPAASTSWEEATNSFRLEGAESGQLIDNRIRGGLTELQEGPWLVTGNDYLGTVPDTYADGAFSTEDTRDLTFTNNLGEPVGLSGKTWRFLVMTQEGIGDLIANNQSIGIGPMDDDTVPNPNASEVILTEAYTVHYEGMVSSVSSDGLTLQIPTPQGTPARTGDVVAILTGPQAGQWRTISQVINANTYVLDSPIASGTFAVSLDTGFVNETFQGNTVDARGSSEALDFVLVGNQFGAKIVGNIFEGGEYGFKITACPSNTPVTWGWTHDPFFGATIEDNTLIDTLDGGDLDVEHDQYTTADAGRVYFSGQFDGNIGVWTASYLLSESALGQSVQTVLVTVGDSGSVDPGELMLSLSGNEVSGPANVMSGTTLAIVSATIDSMAEQNNELTLPTANITIGPSAIVDASTTTALTTAAPAIVTVLQKPEIKAVVEPKTDRRPAATLAMSSRTTPTVPVSGGFPAVPDATRAGVVAMDPDSESSTAPLTRLRASTQTHPHGPQGGVSSPFGFAVRYRPDRLRPLARFGRERFSVR